MLRFWLWMDLLAPYRSSFRRQPDRTTTDPAGTMLAASRTVILDYREGSAVLTSSAVFMAMALTLIWLLG